MQSILVRLVFPVQMNNGDGTEKQLETLRQKSSWQEQDTVFEDQVVDPQAKDKQCKAASILVEPSYISHDDCRQCT